MTQIDSLIAELIVELIAQKSLITEMIKANHRRSSDKMTI